MPLLIEEPSKKMGREQVFLFRLDCIFCSKLPTNRIPRSIARPSARSLAAKALIAAVRPLAGTLSAGSLAAKALIAAARA